MRSVHSTIVFAVVVFFWSSMSCSKNEVDISNFFKLRSILITYIYFCFTKCRKILSIYYRNNDNIFKKFSDYFIFQGKFFCTLCILYQCNESVFIKICFPKNPHEEYLKILFNMLLPNSNKLVQNVLYLGLRTSGL